MPPTQQMPGEHGVPSSGDDVPRMSISSVDDVGSGKQRARLERVERHPRRIGVIDQVEPRKELEKLLEVASSARYEQRRHLDLLLRSKAHSPDSPGQDTSVRRLRYLWVGLRSARASHESSSTPRARRHWTPAVAVAVVVALVCAACSTRIGLPLPKTTVATTTSTSVPGHHHQVKLLPALQVVGNTLELSSGRRFVMRGVIVYAMPFYETNGEADPALASVTEDAYAHRRAMFARLKALGFNTVKIPVSSSIYSGDTYGLDGTSAYLARLRAIVNAATTEGLYVVLCWSDAVGEGYSVITEYSSAFPMMHAVALMFADNPGVIYEPFNEPHEISWDQWIVISEKMLQYWRATLGYRGVIIADTEGWSWAFDPTYVSALISYDGALLGQPNLLIANHRYPNGHVCFCGAERAWWNSLIGQYIGKFPLIGSEYGIQDVVGPPELAWGQGLLTYLKDEAIPSGFNGALMFDWNWVVDSNTMTDPTTGKLTAWGTAVVDALATPPSKVPAS